MSFVEMIFRAFHFDLFVFVILTAILLVSFICLINFSFETHSLAE